MLIAGYKGVTFGQAETIEGAKNPDLHTVGLNLGHELQYLQWSVYSLFGQQSGKEQDVSTGNLR